MKALLRTSFGASCNASSSPPSPTVVRILWAKWILWWSWASKRYGSLVRPVSGALVRCTGLRSVYPFRTSFGAFYKMFRGMRYAAVWKGLVNALKVLGLLIYVSACDADHERVP